MQEQKEKEVDEQERCFILYYNFLVSPSVFKFVRLCTTYQIQRGELSEKKDEIAYQGCGMIWRDDNGLHIVVCRELVDVQ